ncbi:MAG: peptide deformylase [Alphaproteobacteria bacterium]|nr:peptide deformylase [Alphaproteobacteria bacterium]
MTETIFAEPDVFLAELAGRSEQIIRAGHPKLYRPALSVADITDSNLHNLIHDMIEIMIAAPGVGLAAPQVAVGLRVLTYRIPPGRANAELGEQEIEPRCLINPSFEILSDEIQEGYEGCLSYPNLMGLIPRYRHILCRADLPDGRKWEAECKDFEARILQHEIDHLNGVVFVQRMSDWSKFGFVEEVKAALQVEKQQQENDSA